MSKSVSNSNSLTLDQRSHAFNVGIAIDFNPTMALWLAHLAHWAQKNLANNKHIHDGLVWCYDTLEAIGDYFPYFSKRQIETMINNSVEAGLVVRGNYNHTTYDRTCWYALTPKSYVYFSHLLTEKYLKRLFLSISQKCEMDFTEWCNGFPQNVTPIPDTDPDTDPNCVGEDTASTPHTNLKELKKEQAEKNALESEEAKEIFKSKFEGRNVNIQKIFDDCKEHYEQKSLWATKKKFIDWLKREKPENYSQIDSYAAKKVNTQSLYTEQELLDLGEYKHYINMWSETVTLEQWFINPEIRERILKAVSKEKEIINADKGTMQKNAV